MTMETSPGQISAENINAAELASPTATQTTSIMEVPILFGVALLVVAATATWLFFVAWFFWRMREWIMGCLPLNGCLSDLAPSGHRSKATFIIRQKRTFPRAKRRPGHWTGSEQRQFLRRLQGGANDHGPQGKIDFKRHQHLTSPGPLDDSSSEAEFLIWYSRTAVRWKFTARLLCNQDALSPIGGGIYPERYGERWARPRMAGTSPETHFSDLRGNLFQTHQAGQGANLALLILSQLKQKRHGSKFELLNLSGVRINQRCSGDGVGGAPCIDFFADGAQRVLHGWPVIFLVRRKLQPLLDACDLAVTQ